VLLAAVVAFANPQLRHLTMDSIDPAEQTSDQDLNAHAKEVAARGNL
jgi:hypothetical protein